jgi:hypothetical protein
MALFLIGLTRCALCGAVLDKDDAHVATSHFIADAAHPLYRYSDAIMHRACFLRWEHRAAFVDLYNASPVVVVGGRPRMRADGSHVGDRRRRWRARWDALLDRAEDLWWRLRGS